MSSFDEAYTILNPQEAQFCLQVRAFVEGFIAASSTLSNLNPDGSTDNLSGRFADCLPSACSDDRLGAVEDDYQYSKELREGVLAEIVRRRDHTNIHSLGASELEVAENDGEEGITTADLRANLREFAAAAYGQGFFNDPRYTEHLSM